MHPPKGGEGLAHDNTRSHAHTPAIDGLLEESSFGGAEFTVLEARVLGVESTMQE